MQLAHRADLVEWITQFIALTQIKTKFPIRSKTTVNV